MGALARELRVAPSSLYNHFQSRDEVLGAVSDAVVSEIRVDSLREAVVVLAERELTVEAKTELWVSAFGAWGVSYRDAFSESAELVAAVALTPVGWAPQTLRMYELVLEALAAFGCPQERALSVVEALEAFLLGSALDANAPDHVFAGWGCCPGGGCFCGGFGGDVVWVGSAGDFVRVWWFFSPAGWRVWVGDTHRVPGLCGFGHPIEVWGFICRIFS